METKKIFVTVAEFRRGGGSLANGRVIYDSVGYEFGLNLGAVSYNEILVDAHGSEYKLSETQAFVQIDCKPIYK